MHFLLNRTGVWGLAAACALVAATAYAAAIDARPHKNYGRVNFNFETPATLKASTQGNTAVLEFNAPLNASPETIAGSLPDYVTGASLSADKRKLVLSLNKPYRIRQFVSGTNVGIDLIDDATNAVAEKKPEPQAEQKQAAKAEPAKPAPAATPKAAAKPEPKKPEKKLAEKPAKKLVEKLAEKKPATAKQTANNEKTASKQMARVSPAAGSTDPIMSTKDEEAKPATAEQTDAMLSTKKPEAEIPTAEKKPTEAAIMSTREPEEKPAAKPEPATATEPATAPATSENKPAAKGPFIVSARSANGETVLNFPWAERTGAAVFERGRDIWIIFSQAKDANASLLRTVMPKQVASVTQYAMPGYTVLRLGTDGSLHASAAQTQGGYAWNVTLGTTATRPTQDISLASDNVEGQMRMILSVFDVAESLRFYDPTIGDQLIVVPAYENGRGVSNERNYPEFSVLASSQGIAIVSRQPDLALNQTRSGLIVGSKSGLAVSDNLPILSKTGPVAGASATSGVMIPYDQWYVPTEKYHETQAERLIAAGTATKATKAESLMELVKLYLAYGWGAEALGVLNLLKTDFPQYYVENRLALLSAASNVMMNHIADANKDLQAPELAEFEEAGLWRELVALYVPPPSTAQTLIQNVEAPVANDSVANTPPAPGAAPAPPPLPPAPPPKPIFHYLKYNKPFIRFYPPRIRQRLGVIAADAYLADGQEEKALAVFDALMRDGILEPVKNDAEFALAAVAEKKGENDQALEIYDRLGKQNEDLRANVRGRYAAAMMRYKKGLLPAETVADILESARMNWRGDALEHAILSSLIDLYKETKSYADVLRTQKEIVTAFPNDPELLAISGQMGDLFTNIFLGDLGNDMPPLKALSLFYEFRDLTPIGDNGDLIIQKLADRLAAIDLLDRATQLLEHQIKFRLSGEQRSKVGARLALLHLLNQHPKEALSVLEVTSFGGNKSELQIQRQQLVAQALTKMGKPEEALGVLHNDTTRTGAMLRLDVLWAMQDWPNVVNRAEDILSERQNLTEPLTMPETEVLLKLALGYCFEGDYVQLRYLKDYYSGLIADNGYKQIFEFITNDTTPLDPDDFALLAQQISNTESFLSVFKAKIAAGKLSEAVK